MLYYLIVEGLPCCPRTPAQKETGKKVNSLNKSDRYSASWLAYVSAIYSDSHDESATTGCLFELHGTGPPANMYE